MCANVCATFVRVRAALSSDASTHNASSRPTGSRQVLIDQNCEGNLAQESCLCEHNRSKTDKAKLRAACPSVRAGHVFLSGFLMAVATVRQARVPRHLYAHARCKSRLHIELFCARTVYTHWWSGVLAGGPLDTGRVSICNEPNITSRRHCLQSDPNMSGPHTSLVNASSRKTTRAKQAGGRLAPSCRPGARRRRSRRGRGVC